MEEVNLARKEYFEPDDKVTRQATSQRIQMQAFLNIAGPFVPSPPRDRPVAVHDNCITDKAELRAAVNFFLTTSKTYQSHSYSDYY